MRRKVRDRNPRTETRDSSLPGVLITDFYAAYHRLEAKKQRCLTHLLRDLAKLREELPARLVAKNIQPLIDLFQDAITLARRREELSPDEFASEADQIRKRFDERWWHSSSDPDCQRIYDRLRRHKEELLTFLDDPAVPAENNLAERDIRSVAAARSDGGVNRAAWSADAFAVAKTIVRTCQKNGLNFFRYALDAVTSHVPNQPLPLPISEAG
ncbi:IS66 family transposase [Kolteria novifilia]|uniref:IS66 family transposase n=1 Tax=Kolteria novifilia TaxID=2527975 RepID=UPI003AF35164